MKLLRTVQKNMAALGFHPDLGQTQFWKLSFGVFIYSINTVLIGVCIWEANDMEEYINPTFSFTFFVGVTMTFLSIISKNDKIFNTIELTAKELNLRLMWKPMSRGTYEKAIDLVEKLNEMIYFAAMTIGVPGAVLPRVIVSYFTYFTTDAQSAAFELPFPSWLPFDWKNPIGYFFATIWQSIVIFNQLRFLACIFPLGIGLFIFAIFITKDWTNDFHQLDEVVLAKDSTADSIELITEFVRSHSNVKQIINKFMGIFEVAIFADFMCCTITICVLLMMVQVGILSEEDRINPVTLWNCIFLGIGVLGAVFTVCEIGQRLTDEFDEISYEFEQLDWYLFPVKIQQILSTILIGLQSSIIVECFGLLSCSRGQFKMVTNCVYKTFNLLREIFN